MAALSQFVLFVYLVHIVCPSKGDDSQIFKNANLSSDALMNIPTRLVALEQTMAIIVGELQEYRSSCGKKSTPGADIIAAIDRGHFTIAEEKMLALNDTAAVADIVCSMSAKSNHDFGVLVALAKGLNNKALKSRILLNLFHEARESDYISTSNLIALAKCLSEEGRGEQDDEIISIGSFEKLLDKITENTIAAFVQVMKWKGDYQTNSKVRALAADIAEWKDVSEKVMIGLVSRVYGTIDSKNIFKAVSNHSDDWQSLVGVDTLIQRLKDTDSLKGTIVVDIAFHLNEIATRGDLHSTAQVYARQVLDKIPECIRNLMTLRSVCIWNEYMNSFLGSFTNYYAATWHREGVAPPKVKWQQHRKQEKFIFKNENFVTEVLRASDSSVAGFHKVLTQSMDLLDDSCEWIIELAGDSCFLKNSFNSEYLYASKIKREEDEHNHAGTKAKRSDDPQLLWQIKSC